MPTSLLRHLAAMLFAFALGVFLLLPTATAVYALRPTFSKDVLETVIAYRGVQMFQRSGTVELPELSPRRAAAALWYSLGTLPPFVPALVNALVDAMVVGVIIALVQRSSPITGTAVTLGSLTGLLILTGIVWADLSNDLAALRLLLRNYSVLPDAPDVRTDGITPGLGLAASFAFLGSALVVNVALLVRARREARDATLDR